LTVDPVDVSNVFTVTKSKSYLNFWEQVKFLKAGAKMKLHTRVD